MRLGLVEQEQIGLADQTRCEPDQPDPRVVPDVELGPTEQGPGPEGLLHTDQADHGHGLEPYAPRDVRGWLDALSSRSESVPGSTESQRSMLARTRGHSESSIE